MQKTLNDMGRGCRQEIRKMLVGITEGKRQLRRRKNRQEDGVKFILQRQA
jgi:hypothetical protein